MRKGLVSVLTGLALAMGAGQASAQALCQMSGTATLEAGTLDEDLEPESGGFTFKGELSGGEGCDGHTVCAAPASVDNATCVANTHGGDYTVCNGDCSITCGGEDCDDDSQGDGAACDGDVVLEGAFGGVCAGSLCVGGDPNVEAGEGSLYVLAFDEATVNAAVAVCDDPLDQDPEDDDSIDEASFGGVFAYGGMN